MTPQNRKVAQTVLVVAGVLVAHGALMLGVLALPPVARTSPRQPTIPWMEVLPLPEVTKKTPNQPSSQGAQPKLHPNPDQAPEGPAHPQADPVIPAARAPATPEQAAPAEAQAPAGTLPEVPLPTETRPPALASSPADGEPEYLPLAKGTIAPQLPSQAILGRIRYPDQARRQGLQAVVVLELSIDQTGAIRKIEVLKDPGHGFAEAAVKALEGLTGQPATKEGVPVAVRYRYPVRFRLN